MKNRHMIGALISLAPVVAIAQVATTTPPVGNAMESATGEDSAADAAIANAPEPAEPAMDTNATDNGALADPAANVAETAPDPTAPKPKR